MSMQWHNRSDFEEYCLNQTIQKYSQTRLKRTSWGQGNLLVITGVR